MRRETPFAGDDLNAAIDRLHRADRAVEQLAAAGLFRQLDQAGHRQFGTQEAGVRLENADVTFRSAEFRPALSDLFCTEGLCVQAEFLRALLSIANEFRSAAAPN